MLYNLLAPLAEDFSIFNVLNYLTTRTGGAVLTSLLISLLFGDRLIKTLRVRQTRGQPIRNDGPQRHIIEKQGTPTMGGLLILVAMGISTLLWSDLTNPYVWVVLLVTLCFGLIGFIDDYLKVKAHTTSHAFSGRLRLGTQAFIAAIACYLVVHLSTPETQNMLALPFLKNTFLNLGLFFVPFALFVVIGTANAVNLTDGLDGLAIVPVMIVAAVLGLIAYLTGHVKFAEYLHISHIAGSGELAVLCGALIGASLGFLWYNAPPAMVFMGDTGSLSMGSALGMVAVVTKHEIVLAITGGLFVMEALSVMIQVTSYKLTGKRVFKMAPIHHHFEQKGWAESTIVIRFWIIAVILALVGLSTLKLR